MRVKYCGYTWFWSSGCCGSGRNWGSILTSFLHQFSYNTHQLIKVFDMVVVFVRWRRYNLPHEVVVNTISDTDTNKTDATGMDKGNLLGQTLYLPGWNSIGDKYPNILNITAVATKS